MPEIVLPHNIPSTGTKEANARLADVRMVMIQCKIGAGDHQERRIHQCASSEILRITFR